MAGGGKPPLSSNVAATCHTCLLFQLLKHTISLPDLDVALFMSQVNSDSLVGFLHSSLPFLEDLPTSWLTEGAGHWCPYCSQFPHWLLLLTMVCLE